jgi:hypothetical protein
MVLEQPCQLALVHITMMRLGAALVFGHGLES